MEGNKQTILTKSNPGEATTGGSDVDTAALSVR